MDPSPLELVLIVGLAARLTRLVVVDAIASRFRDWIRWIGEQIGDARGLVWADDLVTCPFCVGFWISAAVVASWATVGHTGVWRLVAAAFTLSYAAGHLVGRLDVED